MVAFLEPIDLVPFRDDLDEVKALAMIEDATALALLAAPCLADYDDTTGALKAILRGAILRWADSGTGAFTQQSAGPFAASYDTRQTRKSMFWPSEISQLQGLCATTNGGAAFTIDTAPGGWCPTHADICALNFGALYCSCGAVLTGAGPLYEA